MLRFLLVQFLGQDLGSAENALLDLAGRCTQVFFGRRHGAAQFLGPVVRFARGAVDHSLNLSELLFM